MENEKISFIFSIPVQRFWPVKNRSVHEPQQLHHPAKNKQTDYINSGSFLSRLFSSADFYLLQSSLDSVFSPDSQSFLKKIYDIICTVKGKNGSPCPLIFKRCKFEKRVSSSSDPSTLVIMRIIPSVVTGIASIIREEYYQLQIRIPAEPAPSYHEKFFCFFGTGKQVRRRRI